MSAKTPPTRSTRAAWSLARKESLARYLASRIILAARLSDPRLRVRPIAGVACGSGGAQAGAFRAFRRRKPRGTATRIVHDPHVVDNADASRGVFAAARVPAVNVTP